MAKWIKAYRVTNLSKVDTTWYKDGDLFITDRSIGVLANGKIKTIGNETDLSEYVKHDEVVQLIDESIPDVSVFVKTSDLNGLIGTYLTSNNYPTKAEVQAMIDESLTTEGE